MSYPTLSSLPISMAKGLHKTPLFNTSKQKTAANVGNSSLSFTPYASWQFELDLDKIQGNEASAASVMAGFFGVYMACQGSNGLFLATDPQDNTVAYTGSSMLDVTPASATPMGTLGNGVSTKFQLARPIGGLAWDILQNVTVTGLKVNGVAKSSPSDYSVNSKGVVTFTSAPGTLSPLVTPTLTWQGSFQYLCRFDEDSLDAVRSFTTNSGTDLWDIQSIKFASEFV